MPILYVIKEKEVGSHLKKLLEEPGVNNQKIKEIVTDNGGLDYTLKIAKKYIAKARKKLNKFPDSSYKKILIELTNEVLDRKF
jgi:heptaprenyl diphosphate synthase